MYTYVTYAPKKPRSRSPSICSDNHLSRTSLSIPAPKRWHGAHVAVAATGKIDLQTSESPVASQTTAFMMNRRTSRKKVDLFAWAWRHATLVIKWNRRSSQRKPLHLKVLAFLNCSLSLSNCSLSLFYLSSISLVDLLCDPSFVLHCRILLCKLPKCPHGDFCFSLYPRTRAPKHSCRVIRGSSLATQVSKNFWEIPQITVPRGSYSGLW